MSVPYLPSLVSAISLSLNKKRWLITKENVSDFMQARDVFVWGVMLLLQSELFADILGDSILVDEEVHGVGSNEGLGHVPDAFVVATLTP